MTDGGGEGTPGGVDGGVASGEPFGEMHIRFMLAVRGVLSSGLSGRSRKAEEARGVEARGVVELPAVATRGVYLIGMLELSPAESAHARWTDRREDEHKVSQDESCSSRPSGCCTTFLGLLGETLVTESLIRSPHLPSPTSTRGLDPLTLTVVSFALAGVRAQRGVSDAAYARMPANHRLATRPRWGQTSPAGMGHDSVARASHRPWAGARASGHVPRG